MRSVLLSRARRYPKGVLIEEPPETIMMPYSHTDVTGGRLGDAVPGLTGSGEHLPSTYTAQGQRLRRPHGYAAPSPV